MNILSIIGASLAVTGNRIAGLDPGNDGSDDHIAGLLIYASDVIAAVGADEDLPEFPQELKLGVSDKLSAPAKLALAIAGDLLPIAQSFVSGKAAKALRYVAQVVRSLISGTLPPAPPRAITE